MGSEAGSSQPQGTRAVLRLFYFQVGTTGRLNGKESGGREKFQIQDGMGDEGGGRG